MKNIKRIIALSTIVLCMGMEMPVLAKEAHSFDSPCYLNPNPSDKVWNTEDWKVDSILDANGKELDFTLKDISFEAKKILSDEKEVVEIFKDSGYLISDDLEITPLYAGNLALKEDGSGTVVFPVVEMNGVRPGDTIYMMRETQEGSGIFEVLACEIDSEGNIHFNIEGAGDYLIVKAVSSDGKVVAVSKKNGLTVNPDVKRDKDNKADLKKATAKDANGNEVEVGVHVSELKSDIEQLISDNFEEIFDTRYNYPKNENSHIELVYKGEFDRTDDETGTVRMYFAVEDENEEIYYYALHGITDANGNVQSWEIIECRKDDKTGQMYFELNSFSPVAIIKVMSDQKPALTVPADTVKPGAGGSSSSAKKSGSTEKREIITQQGAAGQSEVMMRIHSSEKTSPRTGEA